MSGSEAEFCFQALWPICYFYSLHRLLRWRWMRYIVTCRPISRQHPKWAHIAIEKVLEKVFSMWCASCPVLSNGPVDTHSDNGRKRCFIWCPHNIQCWVTGKWTRILTRDIFSLRPGPNLYNKRRKIFQWSRWVELNVQLLRVNQLTAEAEESPLLRFVARKRSVKTLQRNKHCWDRLPSND
jgi:hypothetical protein